MIEINLLPGDGKKKRRAKTSSPTKFEFNLKPPPWLAGLTEKITDKYMLGAIGAAGPPGAMGVSFAPRSPSVMMLSKFLFRRMPSRQKLSITSGFFA